MADAGEMQQPTQPLMVGVSTRALFQLEEEHGVFENEGVVAYARLQREREDVPLRKGAAFEVVRRLLALNEGRSAPLVDVILLSRNSPDLSLRAFRSAEEYGLKIERGSFTSGRSVAAFVSAWGIDLFLSNDAADVKEAVAVGAAAAKMGTVPEQLKIEPEDEVRIALDGDAVVFDAASDHIYKEQGPEAFFEHERNNAQVPMDRGPFGNFLHKLARVREQVSRADGSSRVRIAIVTARNAPAHARVIHTLRAWGTPADEAHFVGRHDKAPILAAFGAHIFFDDQERHVKLAAPLVAAGHVPGPHDPSKPVIPATG
jgi:5'-nucleotidase